MKYLNLTDAYLTVMVAAHAFLGGDSDVKEHAVELDFDLLWMVSSKIAVVAARGLENLTWSKEQSQFHLDHVGDEVIACYYASIPTRQLLRKELMDLN